MTTLAPQHHRADVPYAADPRVDSMSLVEIAEQLERVTGWIEAERAKEREARRQYQEIASAVEASIAQIRAHAKQLVDVQRQRMSSFDGLLGARQPDTDAAPKRGSTAGAARVPGTPPKNLGDAILALWTSGIYREPLTTEEIGEGLGDVGYESNAAPASLKSSVNQSLAKLCRMGLVLRLRADGSIIPVRDVKSRARKYLAASLGKSED